MLVTGSFPGQTLPNLPCRNFPVPLDQGVGHSLTRSSHFFCWFQGFSDRFAFYSRGGEWSENSELQKGCYLSLSNCQEKVFLLPDEESVSHRGMFFPWEWQIGGDKAEQAGLSSHQVFPFESRHFFRTTLVGPKVFHLFSSFTSKESSSFSTLNPPRLTWVSLTPISCNTGCNNIYWWKRNQAVAICNRFLQSSTKAIWFSLKKNQQCMKTCSAHHKNLSVLPHMALNHQTLHKCLILVKGVCWLGTMVLPTWSAAWVTQKENQK